MDRIEELERKIESLQKRLSRLSEASRRINDSLELETVLQGVLDSARTLTDSRYGVITLRDEAGQIQDLLTSGLTREQSRDLWKLPEEGIRIYQSFCDIRESIRLRDLFSHSRSLGIPEVRFLFPEDPVLSMLAAPILHRSRFVGNIFLAKKKGGEFTEEDEATVQMISSQAALVIANARRYREEQRARSDLEALVDTSPVGVVVFDTRTGALVSFELPQRLHRRCAETLEPSTHAAVAGKMLEAAKTLEQAITFDKSQMMQAPAAYDQQPQDHPAQGHHAEVASVDRDTQMPAHPGIEPDASQIADQKLQTRIRGHALVAELDGDIAVDTALKICFLSSHSRWPFVGLTGKA